VPFQGHDPIQFIIDANITRRHLNHSQRAMLAAKLAKLRVGANQYGKREEGASIEAPSQSQAAEMFNVSRSTVQRAQQVLERADPEDVKAVTEGKLTVSGVAQKLKPAKPVRATVKPDDEKDSSEDALKDTLPPATRPPKTVGLPPGDITAQTNALIGELQHFQGVFEQKLEAWRSLDPPKRARVDMEQTLQLMNESFWKITQACRTASPRRRSRLPTCSTSGMPALPG
jgi:hypothetical protein